jgi:hypothetical protein
MPGINADGAISVNISTMTSLTINSQFEQTLGYEAVLLTIQVFRRVPELKVKEAHSAETVRGQVSRL